MAASFASSRHSLALNLSPVRKGPKNQIAIFLSG
jgi:hypothetical protein